MADSTAVELQGSAQSDFFSYFNVLCPSWAAFVARETLGDQDAPF